MKKMNIPIKVQIIILSILGVFIFFGGIKYAQIRLNDIEIEVFNSSGNYFSEESETSDNKDIEERKVAVHVVGAVEKPAVYTFPEGARVEDAVLAAVPLPEADLSRLNLALPLQDGKQIDVPFLENKVDSSNRQEISTKDKFGYATPADKIGAVSPEKGKGGKVNINTASQEELMTLPGIGPAIAERIIAYRENVGIFKKISDITEVSGIGEATFAKLKDLITVE